MMKITKKLIYSFIIAFAVLVFYGCNSHYSTSSTTPSPTTTTHGDGTVTVCSVVSQSNAVYSTGASLAKMSKRSQSVYNQVSKATVMVTACYTVSSMEHKLMTSGYIIDKEVKDERTFTYYVTTSASGIFYRYVNSIGGETLDLDRDTTVVRSGDFEFVMADGNRYLGLLVGFNDTSDVAIFKFDSPMEYDVLEFADSDEVSPGQTMSAVGTPTIGQDSLFNTYVTGNISGCERLYNLLYRTTYDKKAYSAEITSVPCFQYDAPFNVGMQGGPILNSEGKVIGSMAGDIYDNDYESLSFGIYGNVIKNVARSIIDTGSYSKPLIGVTVMEVAGVIDREGLEWIKEAEIYRGAYIVSPRYGVSTYDGISPNSAAARAGMKSEEVIIGLYINDKEYTVNGLCTINRCLFQVVRGDSLRLVTMNSEGITTTYNVNLWS